MESIRIVIQGVDNSGAPVEAYALTLNRDSYYSSRYPFLGCIHLRYERGYVDKENENAWFYFDFSKKEGIKNFLIVNVVLNDKEVPYDLKIVGNRLMRTLTSLPRIKKGGAGSFSVTTEWVPETVAPAAGGNPSRTGGKAAQSQGRVVSGGMALKETRDEIAGETSYTAPVNWGLAVEGATFSFTPAVLVREGKSREMTVLLSGSSSMSTGYSTRLGKILFYDAESQKRCVVEKDSCEDWPRFSLGKTRRDAKLSLPDECVRFLAEAKTVRCRLAFDMAEAATTRNFDFSFTGQQVAALRLLARKCLGLDD